MFVLQKEPVWVSPVTVRVPTLSGVEDARFRAKWRLIPKAEREELMRTPDGIEQLLRRSVVELLDVVDEHGAPIPHSAALLDAVIAVPWIQLGLVNAYAAALAGSPGAAAAGN